MEPSSSNSTTKEHTGRWTKEEHEAFLSGLQQYGKEWKKVAAKVKTRTVVQTRTHAQKYFQKLSKVLEDGAVPGGLEGGILQGSGSLSLGSSSAAIRNASLVAAQSSSSVLDSKKKSVKKKTSVNSAAAAVLPTSRQSISAPVSSTISNQQPPQQTPRTTSTAEALLNMSAFTGPMDEFYADSSVTAVNNDQYDHSHGFYPYTEEVSDPISHYITSTTTDTTAINSNNTAYNTQLQIKAPQDLSTNSNYNKYPEPSPAACGKRKIAEITAAQMLVGVHNHVVNDPVNDPTASAPVNDPTASANAVNVNDSNNTTTNNEGNNEYYYSEYSPNPLLQKESYFEMGGVSEDDAFLAEVFGVDHPAQGAPATSTSAIGGGGGADGGGVVGNNNMGGSGLQIVNPDTFGDASFGRRRSVGGRQCASPGTPWDGQLEALVSHVHQQEQEESNKITTALPDHHLPVPDPILPQSPPYSSSPSSSVPKKNIPPPLRTAPNHPSNSLSNAILTASVSTVSQLLSSTPSLLQKTIEENNGYHPLHMAAALSITAQNGDNEQAICEISKLIINAGGDVTIRDVDGNVAMHWAARGGNVALCRLLLSRNCPIDSQNDANETPLHWAMRAGTRGMGTVQLLVESGARTNLYSRSYKRPLDVAAGGFDDEKDDDATTTDQDAIVAVDPRERQTTRWNMLRYSSQCRTLVLHHHECLDHMTKSNHDWEVPDRIDSIMSTLASRTFASPPSEEEKDINYFNACEITVSNEFERATLELLSRIHSADYLAFVNELSKELDRKRKQQLLENVQNSELSGNGGDNASLSQEHHILPFTPMIQKKFIKEAMTKVDGHSDTSFSAGSLKAARRAAGAVQHAVDCVLVGRNRNAFCVVRPPGHHAGINGLLSDAESCGFCLFNNVAAGAMHALSDEKHRPRCERCAIVDIDAHHGNGTEEIVRKCHDSGRLLFFSVHLYDCDKPKKTNEFNYKFYPGTGADDDVPHNVINVPIAPLWREKEVLKSLSTPTNGNGTVATERAQTRLKTKADSRVSSSTDLKSMSGNNDSIHQVGEELRSAFAAKPKSQLPTTSPHYPPHYLMGVGRLAYRRAIQHRLLPALRAFNPDLIIMSTGFDAARGDVGNARHYVNGTQSMGLDLEPEDYAWTSRKICEVADICCNGRVVSVLEGGYGRTPPSIPPPPLAEPGSSEEVRQPLEKGFFSECAMHHLKGLVDPYHAE